MSRCGKVVALKVMKTTALVPLAAFAVLVAACSAQNPTILSTVDAGARSDGAQPLGSSELSIPITYDDVGKPCTPEDEANPSFPGYAVTEINVETRTARCASQVCLVNHYQGRVTCPEGQLAAAGGCLTPGPEGVPVTVPVQPACSNRAAADSVYCSCPCDGPPSEVPFCHCLQGFTCTKLLEPISALGNLGDPGSYCVRDGTEFDSKTFRCEP
jgi:hypothetical protein